MEANAAKTGKLKIFLGMAPGAGKTSAMLDAAYEQVRHGAKVVVGIVEPDDGAETGLLLKKLPHHAPLPFKSNGIDLQELDTAGIIRDRPDFVAVDRLEHINCPGVRNRFRYQDVEEILKQGISVYTTLNVHHIEGLINTVSQVTGIECRERVPDRLFDQADDVELVDMPVDELLDKYKRGGIRLPDYLQSHAREFYRKSNLIALRELTLRRLAKRVNCELVDYLDTRSGVMRSISAECVLAIIDGNESAEPVVKATSRFASDKDMHWIAMVVQPSERRGHHEQDTISRSTGLISELGGEFVSVIKDDFSAIMEKFFREKHMAHIFVGGRVPSTGFGRFRPGPLFSTLLRMSGTTPVTVVPVKQIRKKCFFDQSFFMNIPLKPTLPDIRSYLFPTFVCAAIAAACFALGPAIDYHSVGIILLLSITVLSVYSRRGPIVTAAALSAFIWDFVFVPPRFGLIPTELADVLTIVLFFIVASMTASLITAIRRKGAILREQTNRSMAFADFVRDLHKSSSTDQMVRKAVWYVSTAFNAALSFHFFNSDTDLKVNCHPDSSWIPDSPHDIEAVQQALQLRNRTGVGSEYDVAAMATYYPLISSSRVEGIVGLKTDTSAPLASDDETLFRMVIQQLSMAFEKQRLTDFAERTKVLAESEKLYKALFNSLSHEFRTPLATICGAAGNLADTATANNESLRKILLQDIQHSAARINHQITNLLDMSRIESGHLNIKLEWCDIYDLFDALTDNLAVESLQHPVNVDVSEDFPLIKVDMVLLTQAFMNITENALRHSPDGAGVTIRAYLDNNIPVVRFEDEGPGFPTEAIPRLFEKFFRIQQSGYPGIGLGLSIARGFIEAHGATIQAGNREDKGACIIVKFLATPQGATPDTTELPA